MEQIEDSLKFKQWRDSIEQEKITVNNIKELYTVRKGDGSVLFSMMEVTTLSPEGRPLPPVALLRGHFVSVLTVLKEKETGHQYLLMVKQRRIANGAFFYEHPAGMCDSESNPKAVAVKEVEEETGILITPEQLIQLNDELYYSSPGVLDEGGYFFYVELIMSAEEINALHNKNTGASYESEFISLYVCEVQEAIQLTKSSNALLHIYMYLDKIS